jgi:putative ABC transport system permease protein
VGETLRDLRYAWRGLVRNPTFTIVAVVTLAWGIGATSAVFTVVDAVLLRPLRFRSPERLVRLYSIDQQRGDDRDNTSPADYLDWKDLSDSFEQVAAFESSTYSVESGEYPRRVKGASVTPEFFALLGVDATRGRVLSPQIDTPQAEASVVVGDSFWRAQLGGTADVVGRRIDLNGTGYTVVGVVPPGFDFPGEAELWLASRFSVPDPPVDVGEDPAGNRGAEYVDVIARLAPDVSVDQAQAEMDAIARRLEETFPDTNAGEGVAVVPLISSIVAEARPLLLLLLGAVGFVLLIACANVANLLLTRAVQREREIAIRRALGAGRFRIVRQMLAESLLLAVLGGSLGLAVASWGAEALLSLSPETIPRAAEVSVDLRVVVFTSLVVLGTGLAFGLAPSTQLLRSDVRSAMQRGQGGYTVAGGGGRLRRGLVVAEVAVSLVLLIGTGLMVRTFLGLTCVEPGFDPSDTAVAHVALPRARYAEDARLRAFQAGVLERIRAHPEVESAATVLTLPMHWNIHGALRFSIDGRPTPEGRGPSAGFQAVDPDYFRTLRIPLRRGRLFSAADDERAPQVALVNEALVRRYFADSDPIGQRITWQNGPDTDQPIWVTVVGVVGDVRVDGLDADPRPETYRPYRQSCFPYLTLVARARHDAASLLPLLREAVLALDPSQPVSGLATMEQVIRDSLGPRRFSMLLLGGFAVTALLLAALGLYGVLSFSVSQRSHEIGIRRALGARPRDVACQLVNEGLRLLGLGLALGTVGALALRRAIEGLVYGVATTDPASFLMAMGALSMAALLASYLPAARAARLRPMAALRHE